MPLPEIEVPEPFPEYEVEGVGTVIAHDGDSYVCRTEDGRVIGWRAQSGTPTEEFAAADFTWSAANPRPSPVPAEITPRQIRLWLLQQGISDDDVKGMLAGNPAGLVEWEFSTTIRRDHPLVGQLGVALGFSSEQIDDAFRAAALL